MHSCCRCVQVFGEDGRVQEWEGYEAIISHVLYGNLGWPEGDEGSVVATESFATPKQDREKLTQLMFETFNVAGYYVIDSCVASLYASAKINGVAVDVGHTSTHIGQVRPLLL